jgi:hypothetical protein
VFHSSPCFGSHCSSSRSQSYTAQVCALKDTSGTRFDSPDPGPGGQRTTVCTVLCDCLGKQGALLRHAGGSKRLFLLLLQSRLVQLGRVVGSTLQGSATDGCLGEDVSFLVRSPIVIAVMLNLQEVVWRC